MSSSGCSIGGGGHGLPATGARGHVRIIATRRIAVVPKLLDRRRSDRRLILLDLYRRRCRDLHDDGRSFYHDRWTVRIRIGVNRLRIRVPGATGNPLPAAAPTVPAMAPCTRPPAMAVVSIKHPDITVPAMATVLCQNWKGHGCHQSGRGRQRPTKNRFHTHTLFNRSQNFHPSGSPGT